MKSTRLPSRLVLFFLALNLLPESIGTDSTTLPVESANPPRQGRGDSLNPSAETLYLDDQRLVLIRADQRIIIDRGKGTLTWIDDIDKTYLITGLPFDPGNVLTEVSTLRYRETEKTRGTSTFTKSAGRISGRLCGRRDIALESASPSGIALWQAESIRLSSQAVENLKDLSRMRFWALDETLLGDICSQPGPVLETHRTFKEPRPKQIIQTTCRKVNCRDMPLDLASLKPGYQRKGRMTYADLLRGRPGAPPPVRTAAEIEVRKLIDRFRQGYVVRDLAGIRTWLDDVFQQNAIILGTDAVWPESWEWRTGMAAAEEMFSRDWRRWGNVKIFDDEMTVAVDGDAAWVVAFATASSSRSDDDQSRRRSLARIRQYCENGWESRRALFEIIADAATVLVQYERGSEFITPLRAEFGLVHRDGRWRIQMVHFSHPASGFRSVRLQEAAAGKIGDSGVRR